MQFKKFLSENFHPLDAQIIHLYHYAPNIAEIKKQTNISFGQLYRILEKNGIQPYKRQKPTLDLVKKYYNDGVSISDIAKFTNYTIRHVRNIINGNI